jgi:hypothetical protein
MPLYLQHTLVLTLVALCLAYTGYQSLRSLRGKKSRLGNCCAKGCDAPKPATTSAGKIHFLPAEKLGRKR